MKYAGPLVVVLMLLGCATPHTSETVVSPSKPGLSRSEHQKWILMVGKWYGRQPAKEGGIHEWIAEKDVQGRYKIRFLETDKGGKVSESTEVGDWGISGPVYFTIFRGWIRDDRFFPNDPTDPYNRDAYRIIYLTEEAFSYQHFTDGSRYTVKRVPDSFDFEKK